MSVSMDTFAGATRDSGGTLGALLAGALIGWASAVLSRRFFFRGERGPHDADEYEYTDDEGDDSDMEESKLIFCVRTDLGMTPGKVAAQVGHATLGAYKAARSKTPGLVRAWERSAQPKIALAVGSEREANALHNSARRLGLPVYMVVDAGRTQIAAGSMTVLAVGPAPKSKIDRVTGHLRLL